MSEDLGRVEKKLKAVHIIAGLVGLLCGLVVWGITVAYHTGDSFRGIRDQVENTTEVSKTTNRKVDNLSQKVDDKVDELSKKIQENREIESDQLNIIDRRLSRVEGRLKANYTEDNQ